MAAARRPFFAGLPAARTAAPEKAAISPHPGKAGRTSRRPARQCAGRHVRALLGKDSVWPEVPTIVQDAVTFEPPNNARMDGVVEFTVTRSACIGLAASWAYDGNANGVWQAERQSNRKGADAGWIEVGRIYRGLYDRHTNFFQKCERDETFRIHAHKYREPDVLQAWAKIHGHRAADRRSGGRSRSFRRKGRVPTTCCYLAELEHMQVYNSGVVRHGNCLRPSKHAGLRRCLMGLRRKHQRTMDRRALDEGRVPQRRMGNSRYGNDFPPRTGTGAPCTTATKATGPAREPANTASPMCLPRNRNHRQPLSSRLREDIRELPASTSNFQRCRLKLRLVPTGRESWNTSSISGSTDSLQTLSSLRELRP